MEFFLTKKRFSAIFGDDVQTCIRVDRGKLQFAVQFVVTGFGNITCSLLVLKDYIVDGVTRVKVVHTAVTDFNCTNVRPVNDVSLCTSKTNVLLNVFDAHQSDVLQKQQLAERRIARLQQLQASVPAAVGVPLSNRLDDATQRMQVMKEQLVEAKEQLMIDLTHGQKAATARHDAKQELPRDHGEPGASASIPVDSVDDMPTTAFDKLQKLAKSLDILAKEMGTLEMEYAKYDTPAGPSNAGGSSRSKRTTAQIIGNKVNLGNEIVIIIGECCYVAPVGRCQQVPEPNPVPYPVPYPVRGNLTRCTKP
jgi:hypothetical protein